MNEMHMYQPGEFHNIGQKKEIWVAEKYIKTGEKLLVDSYISGKVIKEKE